MSIASEITRLQNAKTALATSIANKGVIVPAATTIDGYAALVDQIQTGGGGGFPYGSEIEYLELTGTQFINLDYWTGTNLMVKARVSFDVAGNTEQDILSNQCGTSGTRRRFVMCVHNNKFCIVTRNSSAGTNMYYSSNYAANTFYDVTFQLTPNTGRGITVNGDTVSDTALTYNVSNSTSKMRIGGGYNSSLVTSYLMTGKIASISITGDNVLLYDMIPVRVGVVGYLYDKISGTLYGNAGSGSFGIGNDV